MFYLKIDTNENSLKNPVSSKELKLIQSLSDIQNPEVTIFGTVNKVG